MAASFGPVAVELVNPATAEVIGLGEVTADQVQ